MQFPKPVRVIANWSLGAWINIQDKVTSLFIDHAKRPSNPSFPNVYIKNFGKIDKKLYRGAQPENLEVYTQLKALGIKTVVNLRDNPEDPNEKNLVESLGMEYVNIPIVGGNPPTREQAKEFVGIVNRADNVTFVHCKGGRHRTGAMGAVYRFENYKWDFVQAYSEMKDYGFYSSWGFGDIKTFVEEYAFNKELY